MTKKRDAKRSLLMSGLALVLCLVMLGGSSLAWYSDVVSVEQNKIETGVLDAEMEWKDATINGGQTTYKDATAGPIFNSTDKWEPGYVDAKCIEIENTGSLEFKYRLNFAYNVAPADGALDLANVIDVYLANGEVEVDPENFDPNATVVAADSAARIFDYVGKLSEVMESEDGIVSGSLPVEDDANTNDVVEDTKTITVVLMMQNDALNEYQGLSFDFSVQLAVSQMTGEFVTPENQTNYAGTSQPATLPENATGPVTLATNNMVSVKLPETLVNTLPANVTQISLAHTEPKVDVATNTVTFDAVDLLDQNRDVIDLKNNATEFTITLPVSGIVDNTSVDIYHDGEFMKTATVSNGMITYSVTHLCEIAVLPYGCTAITTAEELMNALTNSENAILLKDIVVPTDTTVPVGATFALNLNGKTILSKNARTATHNVLFDVNGGTLSISNGTVQYQHTGTNMEWNGAATVFNVTNGGVLNMKGVTVKHLGGTDMNFAVHLNNWGDVTLNANNCVFEATYCPVRVFNSGPDMNNVTIANSKLTSEGSKAFWVHNYTSADFGGMLYSGSHEPYDVAGVNGRMNFKIFNNGNVFTSTDENRLIEYGFTDAINFNAAGSQLVDDAAELQNAIDNGSGDITLTDNIDLSELGGLIIN